MAVITAPVLEMAVKAPVATATVWDRMILLLIFRVTAAAELVIMVKAPVPVLVAEMMLLLVILRVPEPPELMIP